VPLLESIQDARKVQVWGYVRRARFENWCARSGSGWAVPPSTNWLFSASRWLRVFALCGTYRL